MKHIFYILTTALILFSTSTTRAQNTGGTNILDMPSGQTLLHISATETKKVAQDLLVATLRYEVHNADKSTVQNDINRTMKAALKTANRYDDITVTTGYYNVHQRADHRTKEKLWYGAQTMTLTSHNQDNILEASGKLQKAGLSMSNLQYRVSPELAAQTKDHLLEAALAKLQKRAQRAAKALNKKNATLIEVHAQQGHSSNPVYRNAPMMMGASAKEEMTPPVVQGGESTISLSVSAKALLTR